MWCGRSTCDSNSHDGQHPTPPRPNACVGARAGARCVAVCTSEVRLRSAFQSVALFLT